MASFKPLRKKLLHYNFNKFKRHLLSATLAKFLSIFAGLSTFGRNGNEDEELGHYTMDSCLTGQAAVGCVAREAQGAQCTGGKVSR